MSAQVIQRTSVTRTLCVQTQRDPILAAVLVVSLAMVEIVQVNKKF